MGCEKALFLAVAGFALILRSEGILAGKEAAPHSRPYMASVQVPDGANTKHECGGFLIAEQWVMSAAHCFLDGSDGKKIILGAHSLKDNEDTKQTFDISQLISHPDFSTSNYDNDIALAKLDRPIVASEAVKPIKYLRAGGTDPDTDAVVDTAGWGSTSNLGGRPDKLQELVITVLSRMRCGRSDYYGTKFTNNMLCAARIRQDTCDGDSGGPLLYNGVAVGITSNGGKKCGTSRKPGLYTTISHYTNWIDTAMAQ